MHTPIHPTDPLTTCITHHKSKQMIPPFLHPSTQSHSHPTVHQLFMYACSNTRHPFISQPSPNLPTLQPHTYPSIYYLYTLCLSIIHPFIPSLIHSSIYSSIHPYIHTFIHKLSTYASSITYPHTHQSSIHLLSIHPPIHSSIPPYMLWFEYEIHPIPHPPHRLMFSH